MRIRIRGLLRRFAARSIAGAGSFKAFQTSVARFAGTPFPVWRGGDCLIIMTGTIAVCDGICVEMGLERRRFRACVWGVCDVFVTSSRSFYCAACFHDRRGRQCCLARCAKRCSGSFLLALCVSFSVGAGDFCMDDRADAGFEGFSAPWGIWRLSVSD